MVPERLNRMLFPLPPQSSRSCTVPGGRGPLLWAVCRAAAAKHSGRMSQHRKSTSCPLRATERQQRVGLALQGAAGGEHIPGIIPYRSSPGSLVIQSRLGGSPGQAWGGVAAGCSPRSEGTTAPEGPGRCLREALLTGHSGSPVSPTLWKGPETWDLGRGRLRHTAQVVSPGRGFGRPWACSVKLLSCWESRLLWRPQPEHWAAGGL